MYRDMNVILPQYVYHCLNTFGNTVISTARYSKFGKEKILNELKKHGYICDIIVYDHNSDGFWDNLQSFNRRKYELTHVIVLREKCDAAV